MFKNNKIKKFLAFSVISSGVLFSGTNVYAVKAPSNLNSGAPKNPKGPVRKPVFSPAKLLKSIMKGEPGSLGDFLVLNQSGLLIDLDIVTEGYVRKVDGIGLQMLRQMYMNTVD